MKQTNQTPKRIFSVIRDAISNTRREMALKYRKTPSNIGSYETWTPCILANPPLDLVLEILIEDFNIDSFISNNQEKPIVIDLRQWLDEIKKAKQIVRVRTKKKKSKLK